MPFWINIIVSLIALVISAAFGAVLIPFLKKIHFGQTILNIGPKWHKSKEGTPIMGGFMFILGSLIATAIGFFLFRAQDSTVKITDNTGLYKLLAGIIFALLCSLIGFIDDYIKAVKKQNLGLNSKQKLVMQFLFSALYLFALYEIGDKSTSIVFPFFGAINFGIFYYPLMMLFITFIVNAVNLTDGVDGLCGSVTAIASLAFTMISIFLLQYEQSIFSIALAGGCIGFLFWNLHPAKVFMGDTGSMFLGGAVVSFGMAQRLHLILVLVGIIYIVEALSVVLQVISFKTTGKRIFKMSPIHHHYEMCGWKEYKIVIVFTFITLIAGIIACVITAFSGGVIGMK